MKEFLIAGNWKMHYGPTETRKVLKDLAARVKSIPKGVHVLVCPPSISLEAATGTLKDSDIQVGAQNVHYEDEGAYTGEISTSMITEIGCTSVVVGHSERRQYFGETDATVNKKVHQSLSANLHTIICVGESLKQRQQDRHKRTVKKQVQAALVNINKEQVKNCSFAYEPLWAIGSGETASPEQAEEMHATIHKEIKDFYDVETSREIFVLYGGSMEPKNAESLLKQPHVNGGLIGGASLKAASFAEIISIAEDLYD